MTMIISQPVLIAIAASGGLVVFLSATFCLFWLVRRRKRNGRRRAQYNAEGVHTISSSVTQITGGGERVGEGQQQRKLKKIRTGQHGGGGGAAAATAVYSCHDRGGEEEEQGNGNRRRQKRMSHRGSFRGVPLPVLPPVFSKRGSSFNPFHGPFARHGGGERRISNTWVDEDALHGPRVQRQSMVKRRSLRDSWPLRSMVPTLPRMLQQSHQMLPPVTKHHHQQSTSMLAAPAPAPASASAPFGEEPQTPKSPRSLPQPPRPVLIIPPPRPQQNRPVSPDRPYTFDSTKQLSDISPPTRRTRLNVSPDSRVRLPSSDSTLSDILRSTERRLQDGLIPGVAIRNNKFDISSKTSQEPLLASYDHMEMLPSRDPSPDKYVPAGHFRGESYSSIHSDADSVYTIYAEPHLATEPPQTGLTSPSRTRMQEVERVQSPPSSASSALSTVYSEDDRTEQVPGFQPSPTAYHSGLGAMGYQTMDFNSHRASNDPFVSSSPNKGRISWHLHSPPGGLRRPPKLRNDTVSMSQVLDCYHQDQTPPSHDEQNKRWSGEEEEEEEEDSPTRGRSMQNVTIRPRSKSRSPAKENRISRLIFPPPSLGPAPRDRVMAKMNPPPPHNYYHEEVQQQHQYQDSHTPERGDKPAFTITSPSTLAGVSVHSTPSTVTAFSYLESRFASPESPSPVSRSPDASVYKLHGVRSSPTLGREPDIPHNTHEDNDTVPPLPETPDLSLIQRRASYSSAISDATSVDNDKENQDVHGENNPIMRHLPGSTSKSRRLSTASSDYSVPCTVAEDNNNATITGSPTSRRTRSRATSVRSIGSSTTAVSAATSTTTNNNNRFVPSSLSSPTLPHPAIPRPLPDPNATLQVSATIAALRRMNSAVSNASSTFSTATTTTVAADGSGKPDAGPLHRLRSGKHKGNRQYLALGSPNRISPDRERGNAPSGGGSRKRGMIVSMVTEENEEESENHRLRRSPPGKIESDAGREKENHHQGDMEKSKKKMLVWDGEAGGEGDIKRRSRKFESPSTPPALIKNTISPSTPTRGSPLVLLSTPTPTRRSPASPRRPMSRVLNSEANNSKRGSQDSLGLYDRDGFLISSPVRGPQ